MPSVRQDWRPRWSAVLPGPRRQAYRGRGSPRAKPETGMRADPAKRGNAQFMLMNKKRIIDP
jgi:hypothetical protein